MIDIPKLLPIVRQAFPNVPLPKLLQAMAAFAKKHPDLNDQQAVQAFQAAMQQVNSQKKPTFQGLVGNVSQGAR